MSVVVPIPFDRSTKYLNHRHHHSQNVPPWKKHDVSQKQQRNMPLSLHSSRLKSSHLLSRSTEQFMHNHLNDTNNHVSLLKPSVPSSVSRMSKATSVTMMDEQKLTNGNEDEVPSNIVNVMKQRFELLTSNRYTTAAIKYRSLSKNITSDSHENLFLTNSAIPKVIPQQMLQSVPSLIPQVPLLPSTLSIVVTKTPSPLKNMARLSRSQDNLTANQHSTTYIGGHIVTAEQLSSFLTPKNDVIIVDTTATNLTDNHTLQSTHKTSSVRHSYTELHVDEAPKAGTVEQVKNMFERQIRMSRYDTDKLTALMINNTNNNNNSNSRSNNIPSYREISSPRSRSLSPYNNDPLRQKRTMSVPPQSSLKEHQTQLYYPDLVTSHTPPLSGTPPTTTTEQNYSDRLMSTTDNIRTMTLKDNSTDQNLRMNSTHRPPLPSYKVSSTETVSTLKSSQIEEKQLDNFTKSNLLLTSTVVPIPIIHDNNNTNASQVTSDIIDSKPIDFKSHLALFNRNCPNDNLLVASVTTNTTVSQLTTLPPVAKKSLSIVPSLKSNLTLNHHHHHHHHHMRTNEIYSNDDFVDNSTELNVSTSRTNLLISTNETKSDDIKNSTAVHRTKGVTFFGGSKVDSKETTILVKSNDNKSLTSFTNALVESIPIQVIGGNVKLDKSSIFSGLKKDVRVQFIEDIATFEYPSYEFLMAEYGLTDDDIDSGQHSSLINGDNKNELINMINENEKMSENGDDVDDDELEHLAQINAKFNLNNLVEKPVKSKGSLHTFRPTHVEPYELGSQHNNNNNNIISILSQSNSFSNSDNNSNTKSTLPTSYSIMARQNLFTSNTKPSNFSSTISSTNNSLKQNDSSIQWSSMSSNTDLLF
ncbi:unnamed protein product [Didymodactylos carnosus]|uniref:Uncharacterized protein n=1 Tax=Didymodactylos carnosus TaxID=1234261 RepID=A0A813PW24_9BILA|nr:unnamed protein product [Didymodactylos carnosus]CAF0759809.1 unnamed protein product [Didymodactylos carnosus]CAF3497819.1 unnamed protein product [Didymodactylos carnosus]CAF3540539.1 unnamed protein product [Didymodactylos carnosus]